MGRRGAWFSLEEKLEISQRALSGQSDPEIARAMGRSVYTIRKWRRRFIKHGSAGFASRMGRPAEGVLGSYPKALREKIFDMRKAHPGWGPTTLLIELQQDPHWRARALPSRSRIAAFLKQEGLTRRYQRHTELPQPKAQQAEKPHQEWQLDAQAGMRIPGLGRTSVIHVVDVVSRLKVESCPRVGRRKPSTQDYFLALRRAFLHFGLPERITLDRDTVFYDNSLPSPYPTRIHLWLQALGIEVRFTRKRRPTDHAQVERSHQTMTAQALQGQQWSSECALWAGLDQRRERLNHYLPVKALGNRAPLQAYPQAVSSGRAYRPEWEEQLLSLKPVYQFLAQGRWIRSNNSGIIQLGAVHYWIGRDIERQNVEIHFDPQKVVFVIQPEKGGPPILVPPKKLSKADLMGDLSVLLSLPAYQLAFPFNPHDQHRLNLVQLLTGTT